MNFNDLKLQLIQEMPCCSCTPVKMIGGFVKEFLRNNVEKMLLCIYVENYLQQLF